MSENQNHSISVNEVKDMLDPDKTRELNGILSIFPATLRPFVEVTRLHKPTGLVGFYFPYLIAIFFTASISENWEALHPSSIVRLIIICLIDGLLLRSFGCAWNDTIDRDVDRQVSRCKGRPVARGALSPLGAVLVTLILALFRHAIIALVFPLEASYHALFVTGLAFVYPFGKRLTDFPQVILGTAVGWALFTVDSVVERSRVGLVDDNRHSKAIVALFLALTLWNITYDMVYAFQDVQDDKRAGVRSMAVRFEYNAKTMLLLFILSKAVMLFYAGFQARSQSFFYFGAICATFGALSLLFTLDLGNPESCKHFFVKGQYVVSGALLLGIILEYLSVIAKMTNLHA